MDIGHIGEYFGTVGSEINFKNVCICKTAFVTKVDFKMAGYKNAMKKDAIPVIQNVIIVMFLIIRKKDIQITNQKSCLVNFLTLDSQKRLVKALKNCFGQDQKKRNEKKQSCSTLFEEIKNQDC